MKKFVLAGCGSRGYDMFARPLSEDFAGEAELVGVFDINPIRAKYVSKQCGNAAVFDDFGNMLRETKPDGVIVATKDSTHHTYIIQAMEAGFNVISEKPMTIDISKCNAILDAEKRTGKSVTVTFNCRFMPIFSKIKELVTQGVVGEIHSAHLEWLLDTEHGADYFRRWHRRLENSGGLLVHKATHHFDVVNWILGDTPKTVSAFGDLRFYGPNRKERGDRCQTCTHKMTCEFYFDMSVVPIYKALYNDAESADGYIRDGCVFADEIDIYDTMSVNVKYDRGAQLTYSLKAYSPYEGWKLSITGERGRLEAEEFHSGYRTADSFIQIRVYPFGGDVITYDIKKATGNHGGGDALLRRMLFVEREVDPLGRMANSREGAKSLLIGTCANLSIAQGRQITISDEIKI